MARNSKTERHSERGVVFVQVAITLLVLIGFCTFVLDYGVMWMARGQAQNAADAGALSGALARAFDDLADPPAGGGIADLSARSAAEANEVWNVAPAVEISWACPVGVAGRCVRADVFRDTAHGNPLPAVFGPVLGITDQSVRATATAVVAMGNTTDCMRPFAVADRWVHAAGDLDRYDHWEKQGNSAVELDPHDSYSPTGFSVPADIGVQQILKGGNNPTSDTDPITEGWYLPLRLPDGMGGFTSGADDFREAIAMCVGNPVHIGDYLPLESGVMNGPTDQGVGDLIDLDENAEFNEVTKVVDDSCAPGCAPFSPRIVPITIFDIEDFQYRRTHDDWSVCPPGTPRCVKVVNILGFFVAGMSGNDVIGYLMTLPGEFVTGWANVGESNSFLKKIQLVR